ncbi:unnamed protein product [Macrosiphum euphorbiae]|uniref:Uncharacterized protein n=1 Tax=Macrosiphum euphorbiae TaxID=13131 RepID=A0AAV0W6T8_9HEMI|nr:unnamed protein product [Macrosiphum euphorbiae]
MIPEQRNSFNSLVSTRKTEGFFKQLIEGHLFNNDIKFREFFRINKEQFYFILFYHWSKKILQRNQLCEYLNQYPPTKN